MQLIVGVAAEGDLYMQMCRHGDADEADPPRCRECPETVVTQGQVAKVILSLRQKLAEARAR